MPGFLFHVGASAACPHGGQITAISTNTHVFVNGMAVTTVADQFMVAGCAFAPGGKAQPCVEAKWLVVATRVFIDGQPAVLQASTGLCHSAEQIPGGPPVVAATQARVGGT